MGVPGLRNYHWLSSLLFVSLCGYFGLHENDRLEICQKLITSNDAKLAAAASFMGTKTPYSCLRYMDTKVSFAVSLDLDGCRAVRVSGSNKNTMVQNYVIPIN